MKSLDFIVRLSLFTWMMWTLEPEVERKAMRLWFVQQRIKFHRAAAQAHGTTALKLETTYTEVAES